MLCLKTGLISENSFHGPYIIGGTRTANTKMVVCFSLSIKPTDRNMAMMTEFLTVGFTMFTGLSPSEKTESISEKHCYGLMLTVDALPLLSKKMSY